MGRFLPRAQEEARALLAAPLRWDRILNRVRGHDVFPLFYRNLQTLGFPGVPAEVCTELEAIFSINALRNTLLAEELARVLRLFHAAGVLVIPLKGVILGESLYGDMKFRVCVDSDILVPRGKVLDALRLMVSEGYKAEVAEQLFAEQFFPHRVECSLLREKREIDHWLELHWGLLSGSSADAQATEDLWAEAHPKVVLGVPAYTLSLEWEFLFLAAHASRHNWQGLKWLVDLHEVCTLPGMDWEKVREKANRLGWQELMRRSLRACHVLFETPIPPGFSLGTLPPKSKIFPGRPSPLDSLKAALFCAGLLPRRSEKLRHLAHSLLVPTSGDRLLLRLPAPLGFLYYLIRPLRLGCKLGWWLVRSALERLGLR